MMGVSRALDDAKRIVDWADNGRLADDEWLVERNETAIIAIARALLSTSKALEAATILVPMARAWVDTVDSKNDRAEVERVAHLLCAALPSKGEW